MLNNSLIFALVAVTFGLIFYRRRDFYPCAVFSVITLSHLMLDKALNMGGNTYYFTAAFFDYLVVTILNRLKPTGLACELQKIAYISITVNFLGWLVWFFYLPPLAYDLAHTIIYLYTVYVVLRRELQHGVFKIRDRCVSIRSNDHTRQKRDQTKEVTA